MFYRCYNNVLPYIGDAMNLRKAAEMALNVLLDPKTRADEVADAVQTLRQALAQPEWVCCVCGEPEALGIVHNADAPCFHYTKREWVGLTRDEIDYCFEQCVIRKFKEDGTEEGIVSIYKAVEVIEAKLKEKNA